jgi:WD40 repeat protein
MTTTPPHRLTASFCPVSHFGVNGTSGGEAPSGRTLAAASNDGTVHLWDTSPAAANADVCADAGQGLTRQERASYIPGVPHRTPC